MSNAKCTWCDGTGFILRAYEFSFVERSIILTAVFSLGILTAVLGYHMQGGSYPILAIALMTFGILGAMLLPEILVFCYVLKLIKKKVDCPHCRG